MCGGNAKQDCAGVCNGNASRDCHGICNGYAVNDCAGVCGGYAVKDCYGVCGGTAERDCAGVCGGYAVKDCAGTCGGRKFKDCKGICGGHHVPDCHGVCDGSATMDCKGVCGGSAYLDCFGRCHANTSKPNYDCDCPDYGKCCCLPPGQSKYFNLGDGQSASYHIKPPPGYGNVLVAYQSLEGDFTASTDVVRGKLGGKSVYTVTITGGSGPTNRGLIIPTYYLRTEDMPKPQNSPSARLVPFLSFLLGLYM